MARPDERQPQEIQHSADIKTGIGTDCLRRGILYGKNDPSGQVFNDVVVCNTNQARLQQECSCSIVADNC